MNKVPSRCLVLESQFERLLQRRSGAVHKDRHHRDQDGQPKSQHGPQEDEGGRDPEQEFGELLAAFPAPLYCTDPEGRITQFNEAAAHLWGHQPQLGEARWCGSLKLYTWAKQPLPHEICPMATALKENRPIRAQGGIAERPDGTHISFLAHPTPLHDGSGTLIGAVNMLLRLTEQERAAAAAGRSPAVHRRRKRSRDRSANVQRAGGLNVGLPPVPAAPRRRHA
jgi:PAS domain-containing protein